MRSWTYVAALAGLSILSEADAADWILQEESEIRFETSQEGARFDGVFERFEADVTFDPQDPAKGRARVVVELASARTGDGTKDGALEDEEWFDIDEHPNAVFTVEGFEAQGEGMFLAPGRLTMKGETRDVALPFVFAEEGGVATVTGRTTLDRTVFGVGDDGQDGVANEVVVIIDLRARRG